MVVPVLPFQAPTQRRTFSASALWLGLTYFNKLFHSPNWLPVYPMSVETAAAQSRTRLRSYLSIFAVRRLASPVTPRPATMAPWTSKTGAPTQYMVHWTRAIVSSGINAPRGQ